MSSALANTTHRIIADSYQFTKNAIASVIDFVLPKWTTNYYHDMPALADLWHQYILDESSDHSSNKTRLADYMLRHFDTDGDGHISSSEFLANMNEALHQYTGSRRTESWAAWFSREWPLMDWKVGVFLWKSFGGILVALAFCSVMPGRLHGISARILRWPLLGLVYGLIWVELLVYIVIRIGIWIAEYLIARPKHRRLRHLMGTSRSYDEWYDYADQLDKSQQRQKWLEQVDDETSYEYNWGFILELIKDMRLARDKGDAILALAVLQQCTRKNVGGIMSEDLFSYSNTGEPKTIVREFIDEVVTTLNWITTGASAMDASAANMSGRDLRDYEERLQREVRDEKTKLFGSLLDATIQEMNDIDQSVYGQSYNSSPTSCNGHSDPQAPSNKPLPAFHRDQVLMFLKRARAAYGRTAFCMSGGAMLVCAYCMNYRPTQQTLLVGFRDVFTTDYELFLHTL
jgi:hypothetical protein